MPVHPSIPTVSFKQCKEAMMGCIMARVPVLLIGDPGIGKSALFKILAAELKTLLRTFIGSTGDPTDLGGMPVVRLDGKGVDRIPMRIIQELCDAPGILFLDEVSTAPPAVQAAMLRGVLEHVFGDCELHPETWVGCATNPSEQSPGGSELSAPLMGRLAVFHLRPLDEEVLEYFEGLGEDGGALRAEASDFAVTARVMPDLLQVDIPSDAEQGNVPWGAPRAWERAVRVRAALPPMQPGQERQHKQLVNSVTSANVGRNLSTAYEAIFELRKMLPSVEDILRDPVKADVPTDRNHQIGAVGLVARVAQRDLYPGFIYAARLIPELRAACGKMLLKMKPRVEDSQWAKLGSTARLDILKAIPRSAVGK